MKISYFLQYIALATLGCSICAAGPDSIDFASTIAMEVTTSNSTSEETSDYIYKQTTTYGRDVYGIVVYDKAYLGDVSSEIKVVQVNWGEVYGIWVEKGGCIGTVSGDITIIYNYANGVGYLAGDLDDMNAIALYSVETGDSTGIDVDWTTFSLTVYQDTQQDTSYTARGIYLNAEGSSIATGSDEYIGGSITVFGEASSDGTNIGIELDNSSSVGNLAASSSITVTAEDVGCAYGLYLQNESSIGDLAGTITVQSSTDTATGIYLDNSTIGTISGKVIAKSTTDMSLATAIEYNTEQELDLNGATIRAMTKTDGVASYGTAIKNTEYGIKLLSTDCSTAAAIKGNLDAGEEALQFQSGQFDVDSESWTAKVVTIGSETETAQINVESDLGIEATTLEFYINSIDDVSSITIDSGYTLDLTDVSSINIYLSDSVMESVEFVLTLIDGDIACLSPDVQVNYVTSDLYTSDSLSYGTDSDGNSFIITLSGCVIPEPSTATLSLVALAGLMARRRRQA